MEVNVNDIDLIFVLDEFEEFIFFVLEDLVEILDEVSVLIGYLGDILFKFGFDKKELDESSVVKIEKYGEFLLQYFGVCIIINGYVDSQGDVMYNEQFFLQCV